MQRKGVTLRPRSGAAAESARLRWRRNGQEELPKSEVSGGWEELAHIRGQVQWPGGATRGAVAAQAQEGLEEPSDVEVQEGQQ